MNDLIVTDYEVYVKRYNHEGQTKTPKFRRTSIKSELYESNAASKALGEAETWIENPWTVAAKVVKHEYGPGVNTKETVAEYVRS